MKLICIECKNDIDLSSMGQVHVDQVLECPTCGITLLVIGIAEDGTVHVEIMDEGK